MLDKDILNLYKEGLKYINQVVNIFYSKYRILDKEELKSFLTEKLVLIIKKFDINRGVEFKFFALKSLKGYSFNFIRDFGRAVKVPRKYSELYMKFNSLNRKHNYKLTIEKASEIMGVERQLLSKALEASNLKFSEITSFNSTLVCDKSTKMSKAYLRTIPKNIYEMLEEIYIDKISEERVFYKRGLTLLKGRKILQEYLNEIHKLRE